MNPAPCVRVGLDYHARTGSSTVYAFVGLSLCWRWVQSELRWRQVPQ